MTLFVRDNVTGILTELVPHIFERFTRGDAAHTLLEGSIGLVLSIMHAVVMAHHDHVEVQLRLTENDQQL